MLTVLLAAGACTLPAPAPQRDAPAARAYLEVGDGESRAGSADTAAVAYREAVRLDPSNVRAREAFLAFCARASPADELARGRRLMDAGDCRGAVEVLEPVTRGRADPTAALLEGICRYELNDDEGARPLLEQAQAAPDLATRATYFLGLIELRDGSASDAAALFEQVAASRRGTLADRALILRDAALRSGRGSVAMSVESGYDSNVNFSPDGTPATGDGGAAGSLSVSLRPLGISGPYLRGSGYYRGQLQARDRDLGLFGGQVGWRVGRGDTYALADYAYDATVLGGSPYLLAHRVRAAARWQINRIGLFAVYGVRIGAYQTPGTSSYSGMLHTVDPEVSLRFPLGSSIALGYHAGRDATDFSDTSSWEHGPRAWFRVVLGSGWRASGEGSFLFRSYDAAAAGAAQASRSDTSLYLGAAVEKDLGRWTVRLSAGDRIVSSNLPGLSYSRLTSTLGFSYTLGLF